MATSFYSRYPASGGTNPANGSTGQPAPSTATEVGFVDGGGNLQPFSGTSSATGPNVAVTSSALPIGGATSANQVLEISDLDAIKVSTASIDTKTPALGQQLAAASQPVVLTAAQLATLTPPTTVTVVQPTGTNLHVVVDSPTVPTGGATSALQSSTQGSVAAGTAAIASTAIGGVFNTALPTLTNGQQVAVQLDSSGRQIVSPLTNTSVLKAQIQDNAGTAIVAGQQAAAASLPVTLSNENVQDLYVVGQAAQTAVVANILTATAGAAATDLTGYRSAAVQVISTGTGGTFTFEGSNDNVNFQTLPTKQYQDTTGVLQLAVITATASQVIYIFPVQPRYVRLRIVSTITGGSIQAFSRFSQVPYSATAFNVSQSVASSLNVQLNSVPNTVGLGIRIPVGGVDVSSGAITTTTTTSFIAPAFQSNVFAIQALVTAVSGTAPTYDLQIQESPDGGTNWLPIYDFPRITAVGSYVSPPLRYTGSVLRYVQTVGGTTPSFTRQLGRIASNGDYNTFQRKQIDRTIAPITTNSTTPVLFIEGCSSISMIVNQGTGGSAVQFALDGSDDNVNWVNGLMTVIGVVGGATPVTINYSSSQFRFVRARVVTGVAATTISYLTIIASSRPGINTTTGVLTDRSGTTSATPSTSTQVVAANPQRRYLTFQNVSSNAMWINFTTAANASQPSIEVFPGGAYVFEENFIPTEALNVLSATASQPYTCKES